MVAFNDALDLKTAVADHVGNRSISDVWPRLVQMAEVQLNQRLRTNWQVTDDTLTFASGEANLPADFLEILHVYGPCGYQMRAGMRVDQKRPGMSYSTYSVSDGKIYVRGFTGDKDIQYYAALPTISGALSASNWLLEQFGDVYLYAVALQAAKFLRDVEMATATDQLYAAALSAVRIQDERARWANGIVRVQGMTP